jgi:hypothetical protein
MDQILSAVAMHLHSFGTPENLEFLLLRLAEEVAHGAKVLRYNLLEILFHGFSDRFRGIRGIRRDIGGFTHVARRSHLA